MISAYTIILEAMIGEVDLVAKGTDSGKRAGKTRKDRNKRPEKEAERPTITGKTELGSSGLFVVPPLT